MEYKKVDEAQVDNVLLVINGDFWDKKRVEAKIASTLFNCLHSTCNAHKQGEIGRVWRCVCRNNKTIFCYLLLVVKSVEEIYKVYAFC